MKVENKPYIKAMLELRRSSATQRHSLAKRKGTRAKRKREAIKDSLD